MLISCLLPTFNRYPHQAFLVEEAVQSFLQQGYPDKELIILNDTPNQSLSFSHPQVRVINSNFRHDTLGEKLHWMLTQAQGEYICRWDDDDISLPWRLRSSHKYLRQVWSEHERGEWRPENHWYDPQGGSLSITTHPGNTHIMGIWHRDIILAGGNYCQEPLRIKYPGKPCPSGEEDQTFNKHLWALGYPRFGTVLPVEEIFYLYRWGVSPKHLSGAGGGQTMQETYKRLATAPIMQGDFTIVPHWRQDHVARVKASAAYPCPVAP